MKLKTTTRICAFCDRTIPDTHITCKEHFPMYLENKDQEWAQVMIAAQRRQFEIDNEESFIAANIDPPIKRTYYKLTPDDKQQIDYYSQKGIGSKNIGKILGINWYAIEKYTQRKKGNQNK